MTDRVQRNLRELLEQHRKPATWLVSALGLSKYTIYEHVLSHGRLGDAEISRLAQALELPAAVVFAAVSETKRRPGEDPRKGINKKLPGGGKHGASIEVGLGQTGNGALAAHG